jgi:hypothetical protein
MMIGARADCWFATRSAFCGACTLAARTAEDLWAVGPSDVTQPETRLVKTAAATILHIPVTPQVRRLKLPIVWLTDRKWRGSRPV